ncbi:MarR family winged helix-turn-helix transcriptional regulator [Dactylosporangium sp. NPDC005555]|uniref:MarR family winged helix-turn-helix transcriptional regulator n=1 Tax=Dactylosporangium sp. NPDC005555 TaxID=3154889 RepID=UPI0033B29CDA
MRTDNVDGGGPALFRLVRFWSRRWAAGISQDEGSDVAHVLVLEAVAAAGRPAQIGAVAVELGLDRSNASRMVAASVTAGLVTKTVSAQDARRTSLDLTPAGEDLLAAARAWQAQTFARMVADWPAADARRFAAYLVRLAESQGAS